MRSCFIRRKTNETDVSLTLCLDGGAFKIDSGCGFFDHMLELFAVHGGFGLEVLCRGDVNVDFHHSAEDIGIALGRAFAGAIGDKIGIKRYAHVLLPMDEALIMLAVDISGRAYLSFDVEMPAAKVFDGDDCERAKSVGAFDSELVEEFFAAFVREAKITVHVKKLSGKNTHHIIEGTFKALARALGEAVKIEGNALPSSKGTL